MKRWNEGFLQRVCLNERQRVFFNEGEYLKGERDEREEEKKGQVSRVSRSVRSWKRKGQAEVINKQ